MALAPRSFGPLGGDLIVGNFGDGFMNAYSPVTGKHLGQVRGTHGAIAIGGLWALMFGNGNAAKTSELLFSAGPINEKHGLLGKLVAP